MPGLIPIQNPSLDQRLVTRRTPFRKLVLITTGAVESIIFGYKASSSDWLMTNVALKAILVPELAIELQSRSPGYNDVTTTQTRFLIVGDIAIVAQDLVLVKCELALGMERLTADITCETRVVPVAIVIGGDVLRLGPNLQLTSSALIGVFHAKTILTNRFTLSHNKLLPCDADIAVLASEVAEMPAFVHSYCILPREDQLVTSSAALFTELCMMSAAVDLVIVPEVGQVDQ